MKRKVGFNIHRSSFSIHDICLLLAGNGIWRAIINEKPGEIILEVPETSFHHAIDVIERNKPNNLYVVYKIFKKPLSVKKFRYQFNSEFSLSGEIKKITYHWSI